MDKTLAGLIGAVSALAAVAPAQAAPLNPPTLDSVMQANSYADLLKPIPNAAALLKVAAATPVADTQEEAGEPLLQDVQYYDRHHHHHHHRHYVRHRYHHHHHHHAPILVIR